MPVLATGSSVWLIQRLVPRLERDGHAVVGFASMPAATRLVGSVVHAGDPR